MIVRRWVEGVDERLEGSSFISRNLRKVFPDHWSFMLGEIALYSFLLLVLTGTFLSFFYLGVKPAGDVHAGRTSRSRARRRVGRLRLRDAHLVRGPGRAW